MKLFALAAAALSLAAKGESGQDVVDMYTGPYTYDPSTRVDPFDTMAQAVSGWLTTDSLPFTCQNPDWKHGFCGCLENGNIQSWFQKNSFFYIMETCNDKQGVVLRTGHMQDRHTMPLQAYMACDTLKLFSYCFLSHCNAAITAQNWTQVCEAAHYTSPGCDVDCNAALPQASRSTLAIVFAVVAALVASSA
jgi:hypothetical protein